MQRILLIGSDGMLGSALRRVIEAHLPATHHLAALTRTRFDIISERWQELQVAEYDWVLNASGLTNRRAAEQRHMWTVNATFPQVLAAACHAAGTRLVHFSTDCVFDGHQGPYDEAAVPAATDLYGRSKAHGEPATAMTLRTSIIGPEQSRFYNLLCWVLQQGCVDGFLNHHWNGITTVALARAVAHLIRHDVYQPGVRHIHGDDTTKHDLIAIICSTFGHRADLRPVAAAQPRDTRLRTRHPGFLASLHLPPLHRQIADLIPLSGPTGVWRMT